MGPSPHQQSIGILDRVKAMSPPSLSARNSKYSVLQDVVSDTREHEAGLLNDTILSQEAVARSRIEPLSVRSATPTRTGGDHNHEDLLFSSQRPRAPLWFQATYFLVLGAFFVYLTVDSFTTKKLYRVLETLFGWIEDHDFLGPLVYWSSVVIFSIFCVPESALTVGGGYMFTRSHGMLLGILLCVCLVLSGGLLGSLITFLIARYLAFDSVQTWARRYRLLRAIDRSLQENGTKMVFLLRLSPFLPFNVLNYVMGVTSVRLLCFLLGSFGMIPWVATCAYIGSALKGVSDVGKASQSEARPSTGSKVVLYMGYGVGVLGTLAVVWLIGKYTRSAFAEVLDGEEEEEEIEGRETGGESAGMGLVARVIEGGTWDEARSARRSHVSGNDKAGDRPRRSYSAPAVGPAAAVKGGEVERQGWVPSEAENGGGKVHGRVPLMQRQ